MQMRLETLQNNPVIVGCLAAISAAFLITLWSAVSLLNALFYDPDLNLSTYSHVQSTAAVNTNEIGERNFFGYADAEPNIEIDNLPETKLELTLRGAFTALNNDAAGAIIEDDKKQAEYYSIGDTLLGDATLKAVYADRVILSRSGLFETLYFPRTDDEASAGSYPSSVPSISDTESKARRDAIRERIKKLRGR